MGWLVGRLVGCFILVCCDQFELQTDVCAKIPSSGSPNVCSSRVVEQVYTLHTSVSSILFSLYLLLL